MRKFVGLLLLGLGAFLLVAAGMGRFWAPGMAERTPLDVDTRTRLSGTAQHFDVATGKLVDSKVKATAVDQSDSKRSDGDVVAFVETTCLVVDQDDPPDCVDKDDPRLLNAVADVFASDRHTAMAVNAEKYVGADAVPHEGLMNKFPIDTERKTYPVWDNVLKKAVPGRYAATERTAGLTTYRFDVDVPSTDAEVLGDSPGTYTTKRSIWVEPRTGALIKQTRQETRTLADGQKILDLDIAYTPATIQKAADVAEDSRSTLRLITVIIPIVGLVGGLALLAAGLLVLRRRRSGAHKGSPSSGPRRAEAS